MNKLKDIAGFTMLELMVTLSILGIVMIYVAPAFTAQLQFNTQSEIKTGAMAAGQQILDELRIVDPTTMPASGSDAPVDVTISNRTFSVVTSYCQNASYCVSNNTRHLTVGVSYRGVEQFSVQTVYTRLR